MAKKREGSRYVLLVEGADCGSWPTFREGEDGGDEEMDLFGELPEQHLAEGAVAVFEEAGAEKLRYVNAYAVGVIPSPLV